MSGPSPLCKAKAAGPRRGGALEPFPGKLAGSLNARPNPGSRAVGARGLFLNARERSEPRLPRIDALPRRARAGAPGGPATTGTSRSSGLAPACSLLNYPSLGSVPGAPLECQVSYFTSFPQPLTLTLIICVIGT